MKPAKNHRITAAFFDLFIIGSAVQAWAALMTSLTSPDYADAIFGLLSLVCFLGIVVYHSALARRVQFCTPGESVAGCALAPDGKEWFTIYTRSRWFLFLTLFFLLLNPGNTFDTMRTAGRFPLLLVVLYSCYVFFFLLAVYRMALGRFLWSLLLFALLGLEALVCIALFRVPPELAWIGLIVTALQALFLAVTLIVYVERPDQAVRQTL
jgi:hypothetical protein